MPWRRPPVGSIEESSRTTPPPSAATRGPTRARRHEFLVLVALCVGAIAFSLWWSNRAPSSGDPGGRVLAQIAPSASALPGYGTPALPLRSHSRTLGAYLVESEPAISSCDGRPGTQGWTTAHVSAMFTWTGSKATLFSAVGSRLASLGWVVVPDVRSSDTEHMWVKTLTDGAQAHAMLTLAPIGTAWTFTALAPPVGPAAGC